MRTDQLMRAARTGENKWLGARRSIATFFGRPGRAAAAALLASSVTILVAALHAQESADASGADVESRNEAATGSGGQDVSAQGERANDGDAPKLLAWLSDLDAAYVAGKQNGRPILAIAEADFCPWCRRLDEEIAKPKVQAELARWTLVNVDVETQPRQAIALSVGPIPALRLLTSGGQPVAAHDGYLPADELVAWLRQHYDQAARRPGEELTDTDPPSAVAVVRLVAALGGRDPVLREAALRRLREHPALTAAAVCDAFVHSTLQTRLASLELLSEWGAPTGEMDPWQPETLTAERLNALTTWAADRTDDLYEPPEQLDADQLEAARRDMARLLKADPAEADAICARLARHGKALLPEVQAQLRDESTDQARERLTALRYRLVASDALALSWPGGLERLASTDAQTRRDAAEELVQLATAREEPLLLELFAHPDPLLREMSLRALHHTGGVRAEGALLELLDDPEPSVRAAVLKQLAEAPSRGIVGRIAQYVSQEPDEDLVVHAERVLREAKGPAAAECLMGLLDGPSWRVRAEAAEALGKCVGYEGGLSETATADVYVALIRLLEDRDGFVVSRAVAALSGADLVAAAEPLVQAAARHPELASEALRTVARSAQMRARALPKLRELCAHEDPLVRAAAVAALATAAPDSATQELRAALADGHARVRQAAAEVVLERAVAKRSEAQSLWRTSRSGSFDSAPRTLTPPSNSPPHRSGLSASAPATDAPSGWRR